MTNVSINIPDLGKATGTTGWMAKRLEGATLRVGKNKRGELCLFAKFDGSGSRFICKPANTGFAPEDHVDRKQFRGLYFDVVPLIEDWFRGGLHGVLTPNAKKHAEHWLDSVVDEFAKNWKEA